MNGQAYSHDALSKVVHDSKTSISPIVLTTVRDDETGTYRVDYHGGEKYAVLVRNARPEMVTSRELKTLPQVAIGMAERAGRDGQASASKDTTLPGRKRDSE